MTMSNDLTQVTQRSLDEQVIGNLNRLQEQGLEMPPGYSPQNALKSAFFELTNNSGGNLLQLAANNPETKTSTRYGHPRIITSKKTMLFYQVWK